MRGRDLKELKARYYERRAKEEAEEKARRKEERDARREGNARSRSLTRLDVFSKLLDLLRLFDALQVRHRSPWSDGPCIVQFWDTYTSLPAPVFKERLEAFESAGGVKEINRLFHRLYVMSWRPEPWVTQLCAALFGKDWDREDNVGRSSVWPERVREAR